MNASAIFLLLAWLCFVVAASAIHWSLSLVLVGMYFALCSAVSSDKKKSNDNQPKE